MQILISVTFIYVVQQDRILTAINPGTSEAWSCWLTRRVVLALLAKATEILTNTSALVQRVPLATREEILAFENDVAVAKTAERMSPIPADVLNASAIAAELVDRLSITNQGDNFRLELRGLKGGGAAGVLRRVGLQRILQMLQDEVVKACWIDTAHTPQSAQRTGEPGSKH